MNETLWSTPSELTPSFHVTVTLDGDDDAKSQTDLVRDWLEDTLLELRNDCTIRGYALTLEDA